MPSMEWVSAWDDSSKTVAFPPLYLSSYPLSGVSSALWHRLSPITSNPIAEIIKNFFMLNSSVFDIRVDEISQVIFQQVVYIIQQIHGVLNLDALRIDCLLISFRNLIERY